MELGETGCGCWSSGKIHIKDQLNGLTCISRTAVDTIETLRKPRPSTSQTTVGLTVIKL